MLVWARLLPNTLVCFVIDLFLKVQLIILQIQVDASLLAESNDPDFILPSKKRKTTIVKEKPAGKRPLSKKERRNLESVLNRKKKKEKVCNYIIITKKVIIICIRSVKDDC